MPSIRDQAIRLLAQLANEDSGESAAPAPSPSPAPQTEAPASEAAPAAPESNAELIRDIIREMQAAEQAPPRVTALTDPGPNHAPSSHVETIMRMSEEESYDYINANWNKEGVGSLRYELARLGR